MRRNSLGLPRSYAKTELLLQEVLQEAAGEGARTGGRESSRGDAGELPATAWPFGAAERGAPRRRCSGWAGGTTAANSSSAASACGCTAPAHLPSAGQQEASTPCNRVDACKFSSVPFGSPG